MNLNNRVGFEYLGGLQTLQRDGSLQVLAETIFYVNLFKGKEKVISTMSSRRIKKLFGLEVGKMAHHEPAFFKVAEFVYKLSVFSDEEIDAYLIKMYSKGKIQQNFKLLLTLYKEFQQKQLQKDQQGLVTETAEEISLKINKLLDGISTKQSGKHFMHSSGKVHTHTLTRTHSGK